MLQKYCYFNSFTIYSIFVSLILISNSSKTFSQNPDTNDSAVNAGEEKTPSVSTRNLAPKLLGIFADNFNDTTNILNPHISNQGKLKVNHVDIELTMLA